MCALELLQMLPLRKGILDLPNIPTVCEAANAGTNRGEKGEIVSQLPQTLFTETAALVCRSKQKA